MDGPPEPASEELLDHAAVGVVPELVEALFDRPGPRHLEVRVLQRAERGPLFSGHVCETHEPEILRARESRIINLLQRTVPDTTDTIGGVGVMEVLGDMELVEGDLAVGVLRMGVRRLDVWLPHVHGDGHDAVTLHGRHGCPAAVQTYLFPVLCYIEHHILLQIRHHRRVPALLR